MSSRVAEDYLALIWKGSEWPDDGRTPTTSALADSLQVTRSTVSATLKKLAADGLIDYEPYGRFALTPAGEAIALKVVRRHRLLETFLVDRVGYQWDEVHDEADRLEHAASEDFIERIDRALGYPQTDPHGDPIPREGSAPPAAAQVLSACLPGAQVQIARVSDANPDVLRFLAARGLAVGSVLRVIEGLDGAGMMAVQFDGQQIELTGPVTAAVHVTGSGGG